MINTIIVKVKQNDDVRLMTEGDDNSCIYLCAAFNGKLMFTGGASIVDSVEGEGWLEKIEIHTTEPQRCAHANVCWKVETGNHCINEKERCSEYLSPSMIKKEK